MQGAGKMKKWKMKGCTSPESQGKVQNKETEKWRRKEKINLIIFGKH